MTSCLEVAVASIRYLRSRDLDCRASCSKIPNFDMTFLCFLILLIIIFAGSFPFICIKKHFSTIFVISWKILWINYQQAIGNQRRSESQEGSLPRSILPKLQKFLAGLEGVGSRCDKFSGQGVSF